jgi:hypothetical protein
MVVGITRTEYIVGNLSFSEHTLSGCNKLLELLDTLLVNLKHSDLNSVLTLGVSSTAKSLIELASSLLLTRCIVVMDKLA